MPSPEVAIEIKVQSAQRQPPPGWLVCVRAFVCGLVLLRCCCQLSFVDVTDGLRVYY
jgi:hypothetical protein